ncbi:MAG TPA: type VI secretion system tube protein Hcp [Novosphingobium sp.]|nr:type VI secretion system tube protein Hcp [Novosphingobium sp.]HMP55119.1 type VI secretion system tube protein Hcp [Novosphingobium sp.]
MTPDIFLKLETIKGESKDKSHKGEIDVESFTFGLQNGGSWSAGGGGGAGKVAFQDITIHKYADSSTPSLMQACASGQHIKSGVLTVRKAGGKQEEFYKIALTNILVSSITNTGANGGNPTEVVSLNFEEIKFDYKEQGADGTLGGVVKFGWNLKQNAKV